MIFRKNRLLKQVIAWILCGIFMLCPVFLIQVQAEPFPEGLYSTGAVLMDADSGRVLYEKNADQCYAMASTTKIMTCILALELGAPMQKVTISEYAASMPDVQMNAEEGEMYYLKDLLYSLMLESHNDSAVSVAEAVGGSVERFTALMNQKAEAIGCKDTFFVTPNGLDGEWEGRAHETTATDLALIMRYCIKVSAKAEEFLEITKAGIYEFQELQGKRLVTCLNHNALLSDYDGALTGKTGFTGKAGYCYVGAAKRGEETLVVALLGAGWYPNKSYKWKDAKKLLDYGFANYGYREIGKKSWEFPEVKVLDGLEETVKIATDANTFSQFLGNDENVKCNVTYAKQLQAPVEKGTVIGSITYELHGNEIEKFQIYTAEETKEDTLWNRLKAWMERFVKKL